MRSACNATPNRVSRFESPFENLLGTVFGTDGWESREAHPPVNIREDATGFVVEADLPGVKADAVEVYVKDNELVIQGERKAPAPTEANAKVTVHRQEATAGKFRRVFGFNLEVNPDGVEAHLADGVLTIRVPKAVSVQPRKIAVKGA